MYNKTCEEVLEEVRSERTGLSSNEAKNRLLQYGKNQLNISKPMLKDKIKEQFNNITMFVLIFACLASIVAVVLNRNVLQLISIAVIFAIIILNVVAGVVQTSKMENSLINADKILKNKITVRRNNRLMKVSAVDIVVGDIVYIKAGDVIPADMRIIDTNSLFINDTIITGMTMSSEKTANVIDSKYTPLGERNNMVYMGSSVTSGNGIGVVVATGNNTELGKTTPLLSKELQLKTPLTCKIDFLVTLLSFVVLALSVLAFIVNIMGNGNVANAFMASVSLAVCVVPESLYIALLFTYSKSIKSLNKNGLVVRDVASLENMGKVQVLCVDKGKVLTENHQIVKELFVYNLDEYELEYNPNYISLINCMLLCNNSVVELTPDNELSVTGVAIEKTLTYYGYNHGFNKDSIEGIFPRVNTLPYDRYRKMMSTLNSVGEGTMSFTKGDFDRILPRCNKVLINGKEQPLSDDYRRKLNNMYNKWLKKGYSVMGFASKQILGNVYEITHAEVENDMTFIGACAIFEPAKDDIIDTIKDCKNTGVKLCMLTSDDKESAFNIAKGLGIASSIKQVVTGKELDMMTDVELNRRIGEFTVFSKLLSGQKLRIVKSLQNKYNVAVTGDNVEDVTAMKTADVGIALGESGCEIVKDVAGVVTTTDNLKDIVTGIVESRKTNNNIIKMVQYLLSVGLTQLLLIAVLTIGLGIEFFSPATIVWLNFVNILLPCMGLGASKPYNAVLTSVHNREERFVSTNILVYSFIQSAMLLFEYFVCYSYFKFSPSTCAGIVFATLSAMSVINAYNMKAGLKSIFTTNPLNNKYLNWGAIISLIGTIFIVGVSMPNFQQSLGLGAISLKMWLCAIAIAFIIIPIGELVKLIERLLLKKKK